MKALMSYFPYIPLEKKKDVFVPAPLYIEIAPNLPPRKEPHKEEGSADRGVIIIEIL
jgi:hypothetical protein